MELNHTKENAKSTIRGGRGGNKKKKKKEKWPKKKKNGEIVGKDLRREGRD